jgi:hypothetical protein
MKTRSTTSEILTSILTILAMMIAAVAVALSNPPAPDDDVLEPDARPILIGPYGGIDYNIHDGAFYTKVNGITCCQFDGGTGIGGVAGLKAFIPVGESFSITPRLLYENRRGTFITRNEHYPILGENNKIEQVNFENRLDASLNTVSIDAMASITVTSFGLYVTAGPTASLTVAKSFRKTESIYSPAGVKFLNGSTTRELFAGDLDFVNSALVSVRGGIGAAIAVSQAISINPEVLYTLPLNRVSREDSWKVSSIQATVGVMVNW